MQASRGQFIVVRKTSPPIGKRITFKAKLEDWAEGMDYCAVPVPERVSQAMGTAGPVLVMARVNDSEPFKVSLFPVGGGKHYIRIKRSVRSETKTRTGDQITVQFTVLDRAAVTIPNDLNKALRAEGVEGAFKAMPPGKQSFAIRQIEEAARPETRAKRIQKAVALAHQKREQMSEK
ncbi:MAG: DUF1905 domain-containing protein [Candidatus Eisenbacteria bacterium]|uniref:DUF1905 domain-containing protein n=1 Tax=Eiseniibacteriota bacterium TaxID=2212470 RepID=A0A7Y2H105_UNCEI|nr:DUF1905 domain-containing protein [Candidatus Eisenbacteria bacterium]